MSTRFVKKDNSILVGIAKNGSQAIKQIGLKNDGFEIREQQGKWNKDNFIDWNDKNLLILVPMRTPEERGLSEMIENAVNPNYPDIDVTKPYYPKLDYFQNDVMRFFVTEVLFNQNWNGAKIRFFNLEKLSTHIPKYLGWDIEIPYYNTTDTNKKKIRMMEKLKDVKIKPQEINNLFFNGIKKSKYWINL